MKTCFKCGSSLPLTAFYPHPQMADGRLNKCKACTKRDVKLHRLDHIDAIREYDRQRTNMPHRKLLRERISSDWALRFPNRRKAHYTAMNAKRDKRLDKPVSCEGCGRETRIEAHHHDYDKPLVVVWLCKPCHAIADKIRRKFEATA